MTQSHSDQNKKLAFNTLFLYFRLLFTLGLGLYASRLVLSTLGVTDYGIYNVVGGVVATFTFLQSSLSGSTTRFLNVYMVKEVNKLKSVFSTAFYMHFILALIVLFFAETLGLWFVSNKLNIPTGRYDVALIVYHLSVVSVLVSIIQIPYDAAIIAHEKMNVYAILSILQAVFNVLIIFIVKYTHFDRLLNYAILVLAVSILIRLLTQIYCWKYFSETKFSLLFNKKVFIGMLSFFGWDLYGNMSVVLKMQGTNILQNIFFGPIINASVSIINQAQGGLLSLGHTLVLALKPQIIQSYSNHDAKRMFDILHQGTRLCSYIVFLVSLPVIFYSEYVLKLWLDSVPIYAEFFLILSLLSGIIGMSFALLNPVIHATGKMFEISFVTGNIYLLSLPCTYLLFKLGLNPIAPYYLNLFIVVAAGLTNLFIVQSKIDSFSAINFIKNTLLRIYSVYLLCFPIAYIVHDYLTFHPIVCMLIIMALTSSAIILVGISKTERVTIINIIREKIKNY